MYCNNENSSCYETACYMLADLYRRVLSFRSRAVKFCYDLAKRLTQHFEFLFGRCLVLLRSLHTSTLAY